VYARLPGFRLSSEGAAEAARLAERLAGAPVVAVDASPLERAVETAEILARPHGLSVRTDNRLEEWSFWSRWAGVAGAASAR
jgi:broad specificity phosphatase PhoE